MTTETFDLAALEIIGYSSTLETPTLPRALYPVFRLRDAPDRILFPPYSLQAKEVWGPHLGNKAELEEFIVKKEITQLDTPLPAKTYHDLWVSPDGVVTYAPKAEVKKAFEKLYERHLSLAEEKLAEKDFEAAARHAAVARSVDPGKLDPLIIRGVTEFALEDQSYYEFTRELAEKIVKPAEFDRLVKARIEGYSCNVVASVRSVRIEEVSLDITPFVEREEIERLIQNGQNSAAARQRQDSTEDSSRAPACTRGAQAMQGAISRPRRVHPPAALFPAYALAAA